MSEEPQRGALKNWLDKDSKHQKLVDLINENKDSVHSVLNVYSQTHKEGYEIVCLMISDEVSVLHNRLLEDIRDLGYEVYATGKNRSLYGNLTVTFKYEDDSDE